MRPRTTVWGNKIPLATASSIWKSLAERTQICYLVQLATLQGRDKELWAPPNCWTASRIRQVPWMWSRGTWRIEYNNCTDNQDQFPKPFISCSRPGPEFCSRWKGWPPKPAGPHDTSHSLESPEGKDPVNSKTSGLILHSSAFEQSCISLPQALYIHSPFQISGSLGW